MDLHPLLANLDFSRTRLLATLDLIEKSGQDTSKVLAWRPAPRAGILRGRRCIVPRPTTGI